MQNVKKEIILKYVKKSWELTEEEIAKIEPYFQKFKKAKQKCAYVLRMRMQGITREEIGKVLGVTRERIKQLEMFAVQRAEILLDKKVYK